MKPMSLIASLTLLILLESGCGTPKKWQQPIREYRVVVQPVRTGLTASIGSSLFRLNKLSDLPNAYGGRDIYEGKVDRGYAEVKLAGIRDARFVEIVAYDLNINSDETTMTRYAPLVGGVSQNIEIAGSPEATGVNVTIDTSQESEYVLSGIRIKFLEVRSSSVVYIVEDTLPPSK